MKLRIFISVNLLLLCYVTIKKLNAQITSDSVKQGEVTWKFSALRPVGQFANGDWWVLAPVTITEILPEYKKIKDSVSLYSTDIISLTFYVNGWEVNPVANQYKHGFDGALYYNKTDPGKSYFDSTLVPKLPYSVTSEDVANSGGAVSIVKIVSNMTKDAGKNYLPYRRIKSAKVLTVVSGIPQDNGSKLFRPPYVKGEKPFYSIDNIRWDKLPSYAPAGTPPTLESIESLYRNTGLAHAKAVRNMLPVDAYKDDYQPGNCPSINEALLRLMLNDKTPEEKKPVLIAVIQRGIDIIHWQIQGNVQPESGHQPGWLAIPSFSAALLDIDKYNAFLKTLSDILGNERFSRKNFHEYCMLHHSKWNPNIVLWGTNDPEDNYWGYIIKQSGNRSISDPYGYIDGGKSSEPSYQAICINGYKGEVLCAHLMPAMREVWFDSVYLRMTRYVDRMVQIGKWTQPDPCAPAEGVWRGAGPKNGTPCTSAMLSPSNGDTCYLSYDNYGLTFGPDPENPGQCICDRDTSDGTGRFPQIHGAQNGWQYQSKFVDSMWNAYRKYSPDDTLFLISPGNIMLSGFQIYQNYPNPFSASTKITFTVPEKGHFIIGIFDLTGRSVAVLYNGILPEGTHQLQWDGTNNTGQKVNSGLYFCQLKTNFGFALMNKMLFLP